MKPASRVPMALHWPVMEKGRGTGASDISVDEGEIIDGGDSSCALSGVVDTHRPANEGGLGTTVERARLGLVVLR